MGKKLTQTQIDAFYRDGFVSPVDAFTEEEAKQLRAELEAAEENGPTLLREQRAITRI